MKFLIFCGVVATILIMCAGCVTPANRIHWDDETRRMDPCCVDEALKDED